MSIAFGSIASSVPTSKATSVTVTCPSATQTGDLLLFFAANSEPTTWGSNPSGWTLVTKPGSTSTNLASACWYKIATASDVAGSTTYTASCGGTSSPIIGVIIDYTGVNSTQFPLSSTKYGLTHDTSAGTASAAPTNPSSINATDLVCRVYIAGSSSTSSSVTLGSAPSGWTQRGSGSTGPTAISFSHQVGMIVCDQLAGSDSQTETSNASSYWDIYSIAIPAAASNTGQFMPFFM